MSAPQPPRPRNRADYQKKFDYKKYPGRTKQADAKQTNLRKMVERYRETGIRPPFARNPQDAVYANFSNVTDYLDAVQRVHDAQASFDELPAALRDHFRNDPLELVEAWHDPNRQQELIDLGVLEDPNAVPPATPSTPAPAAAETQPEVPAPAAPPEGASPPEV